MAHGPLLQGFARPVTDFSRGAPVEEMIGAPAIVAVRAMRARERRAAAATTGLARQLKPLGLAHDQRAEPTGPC